MVDRNGLEFRYRVIEMKGPNESILRNGREIKVSGVPAPEVRDPFFLIKLKDPYSRPALLAYADACEGTHPRLAAEIRKELGA